MVGCCTWFCVTHWRCLFSKRVWSRPAPHHGSGSPWMTDLPVEPVTHHWRWHTADRRMQMTELRGWHVTHSCTNPCTMLEIKSIFTGNRGEHVQTLTKGKNKWRGKVWPLVVFLRRQFSDCQEEPSRKCETVAFWLNNNRWRLTVNWCESWSQMNYAGDKMERWRNHLCLLISYHSLLLSRFIKCCRCALIVLGLIESVNLPFNISCDQSQPSPHRASIHPDLTSCLLESSFWLVLSLTQQILTSLQFNCNKMSASI